MFGRNRVLLVCLLSVVFGGPLPAQYSAARLQGTVKDASGAVIPGAKVAAQMIATGTILRTESNEAGLYVFPTLQPGKYRLTVESPDMENWQGDLELMAGQEAAFDPALKVASASTRITVAGDVTPLLITTSPTLSNVMERERIEQLPLDGRNVANLLLVMVPGMESGPSSAIRPSPFGMRDGIVQFQQDGASLMDDNVGMLTRRPPGLDTVQEFNVQMSVASARYESPVTAVLSTRSGTNEWHGGLFYTGRNNGFGLARARQDYFTRAPQLIRNEYGASLGGPIELPHLYNGRNRTFFFFSYEGSKLRQGSTIGQQLPTAAMRQGDFSQLTTSTGLPVTLYNPWTTGSKALNYARQPFPNNQIPATLESPLAKYIYSVLPLPTLPEVNPAVADNYFGPSPAQQDSSTYTVRIDHQFSERNQVFGRYTLGNYSVGQRYASGTNIITNDKLWNYAEQGNRVQTPMATWNHTFGPHLFVETMGIWSNDNWTYCQTCPNDVADNLTRFGLPNVLGLKGGPNITNGPFGFTFFSVGPRAEQTQKYVAEQNYTYMKGKHQIRFGWHFQNEMLDVEVDRTPGENINFASGATAVYDPSTGSSYGALTRTGDNGANLFLGVAGAYQQTLQPGNLALRSRSAAGYVQDDWKISGNLTLNLGLRYDYFPMLIDANGMNAAFDWTNHAIVHTASLSQMIANKQTNQAQVDAFQAIGVKFETPDQAGWKGNMYNVGERNFGPRMGLAYSMKIGRRTVVLRGGFGAFRWQLPARIYMSTMRNVPPLLGTVNYNINSATYTPDGLPNLGIRSAPTVIAGVNSQNAITANSVSPVARGVSLTAMDHDLPTSVSRQWNVTLETEIVRNTRLRVAYIGNQGRNLDQTRDSNAQPTGYVWYATTHQPLPTGAYSAVTGRAYDSTTYGTISVWSKKSFSNFNGLQVELQRRFSNGLAFQAYYVLSNALYTGSEGEATNSDVPDPAAFLPGTVPTNPDAMNRFWNYEREASIPHHRFNWNFVYQLPFGKGKKFLSSSGAVLDRIAGGWQLSAYATVQSRYWALPTGNWDLGTPEIYGFKYPIQDCRSTAANATSASCIPGYLYYNGYLPANLINTHNKNGVANGIMGVPSDYYPAQQPLFPVPPGGCGAGDPNCGTNNVTVPLNNGTTVRVAYGNNGLHPWRNQYMPGPWTTMPVNASLFKVVPIHERLKLRIQMDAFNALNMPGVNNVAAATGFIAFNTSNNSPRVLQWSLRLNW